MLDQKLFQLAQQRVQLSEQLRKGVTPSQKVRLEAALECLMLAENLVLDCIPDDFAQQSAESILKLLTK